MSSAEKLGCVIKLIAWMKLGKDGSVAAGVEPCLVPKANQLASVDDVFNAVLVKGDMLGDVVFYGKGAGKLPTASAVVADVVDALKNGAQVHDSLFWQPADPVDGMLTTRLLLHIMCVWRALHPLWWRPSTATARWWMSGTRAAPTL